MTDTTPPPAHPPRLATKPARRKPGHKRHTRPAAKPTVVARHGLLPGDPKP